MTEKSQLQTEESSTRTDLLEVDTSKLSSPALARLIEEVRNEEASPTRAYSRMHHKHNKS